MTIKIMQGVFLKFIFKTFKNFQDKTKKPVEMFCTHTYTNIIHTRMCLIQNIRLKHTKGINFCVMCFKIAYIKDITGPSLLDITN